MYACLGYKVTFSIALKMGKLPENFPVNLMTIEKLVNVSINLIYFKITLP